MIRCDFNIEPHSVVCVHQQYPQTLVEIQKHGHLWSFHCIRQPPGKIHLGCSLLKKLLSNVWDDPGRSCHRVLSLWELGPANNMLKSPMGFSISGPLWWESTGDNKRIGFRNTGTLWGKNIAGHRWIPLTRDQYMRNPWVSLLVVRSSWQTVELPVISDPYLW